MIISRYRVSQILREATRYYAGVHQKVPVLKLPSTQITELKEKLTSGPLLSPTEWSDIRKSILDDRRFSSINVDSTVLGLCSTLDSGKSYVHFLRAKGYPINLAINGKLLRLYRLKNNTSNKLTNQEKQEILEMYAELRENNPVLDAYTCEHFIAALTLTDQWRLSFELLEMIKLSGIPDSGTYNYIIERCFHEEDCETGWKLLEEEASNSRLPNDDVFLAWIDYSMKDIKTYKSNIEKMLRFSQDKSIFFSKRIGSTLQQIPVREEFSAVETRITDNGKCSNCKATLASIVVSDESFQALRDAFMQAVIIKKDIFNKTTPEELERFQKFLRRTKPYDVVIDGLNVAFSTGNQKSPAVYAMHLAAVVKHYVRQKKRVLVIGRQHMNRWHSKDMKYIREKGFLFLTEDLSQDDPFLLYAALESGPHTDFFSRDLMRKHSFLLGKEHGSVFKRWQQEHQYSLLSITPDGRVIIKAPFKYELYAHRSPENPKRWHIPLVDDCSRIPKVEKQSNWLCLEMC